MKFVFFISVILFLNSNLYCQQGNNSSKRSVQQNVIEKTDVEYQYSIGDLKLKSKHINLGYVKKGEVKSKTMVIFNSSDKPMTLEFEDLPDYIEILADPIVLNPDSNGNIIVKYHSDMVKDWDYIIDRVTLVINNKKMNKSKLAITANICEDFSNLTTEQFQISPIASYESTTKLLDTLQSKNKVELSFIVRNLGATDLIIRDVNPSCGCTAAMPKKYIVAPGDSTTIDAIFNPKGKKGPFTDAITVITNDPKNNRQYLWLKGYIKN